MSKPPNGHPARNPKGGDPHPGAGEQIWCTTIFGYRTRRGLVEIGFRGVTIQVEPDDARAFAGNLLAAAEAAETDEYIHTFFKKVLGAEDDQVLGVLGEFRKWRDERRRARGPIAMPSPDPPAPP